LKYQEHVISPAYDCHQGVAMRRSEISREILNMRSVET